MPVVLQTVGRMIMRLRRISTRLGRRMNMRPSPKRRKPPSKGQKEKSPSKGQKEETALERAEGEIALERAEGGNRPRNGGRR